MFQQILAEIGKWLVNWMMIHNFSKTGTMQFGKRSLETDQENSYLLLRQSLQQLQLEKDLGVLVDKNLTFDNHVEVIVKKGLKTSGWISQVFRSRQPAVLVPVY